MKTLMTMIATMMMAQTVFAGTMDCSVVYDEFQSLMHKSFLINPSNYVSVKRGRMSRSEYNSEQKGKLLQIDANKGWGVAIVHTNRNTWGKLMFTWGAPMQNGHPSLIIKDLTLYGRVLDGYAPRTTARINVPTSYTVDLDTATIGGGAQSDIWFHNVDGNTMYIEAVNGAEISFPMESMCR